MYHGNMSINDIATSHLSKWIKMIILYCIIYKKIQQRIYRLEKLVFNFISVNCWFISCCKLQAWQFFYFICKLVWRFVFYNLLKKSLYCIYDDSHLFVNIIFKRTNFHTHTPVNDHNTNARLKCIHQIKNEFLDYKVITY